MVIALALLGGMAKGAVRGAEKRREEERQYLRDRMLMAARNREKYMEQVEAERKSVQSRWERISPYTEGMTEQQKIALIANPEIAEQYYKRASSGEGVDVNTFLLGVQEKLPEHITSVQQYINNIGAARPQQAGTDAINKMKSQQQTFRGIRVGVGEEDINREAAKYGATAEELLGFESPRTVQRPDVGGGVTINPEAMKKPLTFAGEYTRLENEILKAKKAGDTKTTESLTAELQELRAFADSLEPEQKKLVSELEKYSYLALYGKTPEERAAADKEVKRIVAYQKQFRKGEEGDKALTYSQMMAGARARATAAVRAALGNDLKGGWVNVTDSFGNTYREFSAASPEMQQRALQIERKAMMEFLTPFAGTVQGRIAMEALLPPMPEDGVAPIKPPRPDTIPKPSEREAPATPTSSNGRGVPPNRRNQQIPQAASAAPKYPDGYLLENDAGERFIVRNGKPEKL